MQSKNLIKREDHFMSDDYIHFEEQYLKVEKDKDKLKTSDDFKTVDFVLDFATAQVIYKLQNRLIIGNLINTIATGKESAVFLAESGRNLKDLPNSKNYPTDLPNYLAIKVYKTSTLEFKRIQSYIQGDPRFRSYKKTTKGFMKIWGSKEFRNLKRMKKAGLKVPYPFLIRENVLVMEFIGDGEKRIAAPKLHEIALEDSIAHQLYQDLIYQVETCYQKAKLIHGDLSEYNILFWDDNSWIIDVSQAVTLDHPMADYFLLRDINNLQSYFLNYINSSENPVACFKRIVGRRPDATALAQVTLHDS